MSLGTFVAGFRAFGFPRVSGDEPSAAALTAFAPAFSPRERG